MKLSEFQQKTKINRIAVAGDTYRAKDTLKKLGYKWNSDSRAWIKESPKDVEEEFEKVKNLLQRKVTTFNIYVDDTKENYFLCKELNEDKDFGLFLTMLE